MLTAFSIRNDVIRVVAEELGSDPAQITDATTFESLGADSLDFVNLMMAIGSAVGKDVPEPRWHECSTIGDVVRILSE